MLPARTRKRWSGRLRTGGALLSLLGAVALGDALLGLAAPSPTTAVYAAQSIPLAIGGFSLALGGTLFAIGRRWR